MIFRVNSVRDIINNKMGNIYYTFCDESYPNEIVSTSKSHPDIDIINIKNYEHYCAKKRNSFIIHSIRSDAIVFYCIFRQEKCILNQTHW